MLERIFTFLHATSAQAPNLRIFLESFLSFTHHFLPVVVSKYIQNPTTSHSSTAVLGV